MNTNEVGKEKLCAFFNDSVGDLEGLTVALDFVQDGPIFEGSDLAWVNITKPGCYILEPEWRAQSAAAKLIKAWKELTSEEREGFILGLEAAKTPPAEPREIPF